MSVRWFILALGLFSLGPFARDAAREQGLPGRGIDPVSPAARVAKLTLPDGVFPANTARNRGLPSASRDSHDERRPVTSYRAVLRRLCGPRFLFRNQGRLTPYGNVLFGGVCAAGGKAPTSTIAAANKRH